MAVSTDPISLPSLFELRWALAGLAAYVAVFYLFMILQVREEGCKL